jgi:hypothetical protein
MADWTKRGTDVRDIGICFYCGEPAVFVNKDLEIDLCDDPQCVEEATYTSDSPKKDLYDLINNDNEGKENDNDDLD